MDGNSVTVGGFLSECYQSSHSNKKPKTLVLRSLISSSDYTKLVFVKKKDLKNIDEESVRLKFHYEFLKDFNPYAVK